MGAGEELVFLAKRGEELIGTISLVDFDDLEEKAASLGIEALHLWTEDQSVFYNKRGYRILTASALGDLDIDIMRKSLVKV
jgi:N-acetylglutamate synthase-like GNAT family acetyltransferase